MKTKCEGNCCFAEFFGPQEAQKFRKLKRKYKPKSMRKMLSDANTTKEDKERLLRDWYACVNANSIKSKQGRPLQRIKSKNCKLQNVKQPPARRWKSLLKRKECKRPRRMN